MQPHDIIRMEGRTWEIEGVHLGGLGQESVYAMRSLDRHPAAIERIGISIMTVPCEMLDTLCRTGYAEHYRPLNQDAVMEVRHQTQAYKQEYHS